MAQEHDPAQSSQICINVLGGFSLNVADGTHIPITNRKACGLLAYLALSQNRTESRERLAGLFWSERGETQARASLRQTLKQLRLLFEKTGFSGFNTNRHDVFLDTAKVEIDLISIAHRLENGEISEALIDGRGAPENILYGFESLDQSFNAWLHVIRQNWQDRLTEHLQSCINRQNDNVAKHAAEALLHCDPTHEGAHRCLIHHHFCAGNTATALKQYKILWDLLDSEFDMEPDEETLALIAEIKAGTYQGNIRMPADDGTVNFVLPDICGTSDSSNLPAIGISKFTNASEAQSENYLVGGFQRELIASMVRFREWVIVEAEGLNTGEYGGNSSWQTDYQLTGVYYEFDNTIRLVINLMEIATRRYIWSEQIELTLENWFKAQKEIVRRNAIALNLYISAERMARISERPDVSLGVYDRWLRGQTLAFLWRPEVRDRSEKIFKSIIEEAPNFSPAYSSLVQLRNSHHLVFPGVERSKAHKNEAISLSKQAIEIDPLDSRSHLCLAWSHAMNDQFSPAELYFRLALDLNGNDAWTLVSAALGLAYLGNSTEAQQFANKALRLNNSATHWGYQSGVRFMNKDYLGCIEAADMSFDRLYYLSGWKTAALAHLGQTKKAKIEGTKFLNLIQTNWFGSSPPVAGDVAHWLIKSFPLRTKEAKECLQSGLRIAGIH